MIELRPYQHELLDKVRLLIKQGHRRIVVQSPTGSGKTCLTAAMLMGVSARKKRSWFMVHRRELIDQSSETFRRCELPHGIISAGYAGDPRQSTQLCGIQSLARRMDRVQHPDLAIFDEAHHLPSKSWSAIARELDKAVHILLTATPSRLDGAGLAEFADAMVQGPTVAELIEQGYLAPYRLFAPKLVDTSGLHSSMGEFIQAESEALVDKPTITGDAIREYLRYCEGKRALVRAVSIKHSMHIAEQFKAAGIACEHVDGNTDDTTRRALFEGFRQGSPLVLTQVQLCDEGVDVPGIEAVIDLCPSQSLVRCLQFWGRALRPMPGKVAVILDHVGNAARHGRPDDVREWTLQGREKRVKKSAETPVKQCPMCYRTIAAAALRCSCGYVYEAQAREVAHVEGDLVEVDAVSAKREQIAEQARARGLDQLTQIGINRHGPDKGPRWALHVFKARHEKMAREAELMAQRYQRETGT